MFKGSAYCDFSLDFVPVLVVVSERLKVGIQVLPLEFFSFEDIFHLLNLDLMLLRFSVEVLN